MLTDLRQIILKVTPRQAEELRVALRGVRDRQAGSAAGNSAEGQVRNHLAWIGGGVEQRDGKARGILPEVGTSGSVVGQVVSRIAIKEFVGEGRTDDGGEVDIHAPGPGGTDQRFHVEEILGGVAAVGADHRAVAANRPEPTLSLSVML